MRFRAGCLSVLLAVATAGAAAAGPVADAAARAEALQGEGKPVEALEALDDAIDAIWAASPLSFRKVVLVESAGSHGSYVERTDRRFRPDEKLRVYVEPVGYGFGGSGNDANIAFTADLAIENMTGQVLTEVANLFTISVDSAPDRHEFGMTLAFGVPYLRPGEYVGRFTVHDRNSGKTGSFDVPFSVTAPASGEAAPMAGDAGGAAQPNP